MNSMMIARRARMKAMKTAIPNNTPAVTHRSILDVLISAGNFSVTFLIVSVIWLIIVVFSLTWMISPLLLFALAVLFSTWLLLQEILPGPQWSVPLPCPLFNSSSPPLRPRDDRCYWKWGSQEEQQSHLHDCLMMSLQLRSTALAVLAWADSV